MFKLQPAFLFWRRLFRITCIQMRMSYETRFVLFRTECETHLLKYDIVAMMNIHSAYRTFCVFIVTHVVLLFFCVTRLVTGSRHMMFQEPTITCDAFRAVRSSVE